MLSSSPLPALIRWGFRSSLMSLVAIARISAAVAQTDQVAFRIGHTNQIPAIDGNYSAAEWIR